jgi:O-antigen/teichoic acid export membrane protein
LSLKKNILANYLGQGWVALMGIAFVPVYIKYLGMEAYGLIGIYLVFQAWVTLLDMGMTPTLGREMARFTGGAHTPQSIRDLLRSLEIICVGISILIVFVMLVLSDWLTHHWLHVGELPLDRVSKTLNIMGLVAAVRFVEGFYRSAIAGLQAQVWLNIFSAIMATIRGLGAIGLLVWFSPTIEAFFWWQGTLGLLTVVILAIRVNKILPVAKRSARFSQQALLDIRSFAKGMVVTTLLSLILTHSDKILLSRLLNLESFGAYTLAGTVANTIMLLVAPLAQSYAPRFTELLTQNNEKGLVSAYHQGSQLMTVMVVPATLMLILHGETLLALWTKDILLAKNAAPLVALLALGTTFNALMNLPYMLQLSYGWSTFAAKVNVVAVVILIPVLFWATPRYGAIGAAWIWVAVNASYIFIVIHIMHRYILMKEKWKWYRLDVAYPAAAATLIAYSSEWIYPMPSSKYGQLIWLFLSGVSSLTAALCFASILKNSVFAIVRSKLSKNV